VRKLQTALAVLALSTASSVAVPQTQPTPPQPTVKVGQMAPDFKLVDQNGEDVRLSDFRGKKNVALAFYLFAFTGG
jgi:cytochrome oxidase Cu insertion factor (SCO1/SenC/PrrC family)